MIEILEFNPDHLDWNFVRQHEKDVFQKYGKNLTNSDLTGIVSALVQRGSAMTLRIDGDYVTYGGVFEYWEGLYELWQIPTIFVKKYQKLYCKHVKDQVNNWHSILKPRRFQSICKNDGVHNRWMQYILFEKESILRKYGINGEDYAMFTRF